MKMAVESGPLTLQGQSIKQIPEHPLSPLSAAEIQISASIVRSHLPGRPQIQFKNITLEEPLKASLVPYLDAERAKQRLPLVERKSFVSYYVKNTVPLFFGDPLGDYEKLIVPLG